MLDCGLSDSTFGCSSHLLARLLIVPLQQPSIDCLRSKLRAIQVFKHTSTTNCRNMSGSRRKIVSPTGFEPGSYNLKSAVCSLHHQRGVFVNCWTLFWKGCHQIIIFCPRQPVFCCIKFFPE